MRTFVWFTIAIFISTVFWPQLINSTGFIYCLLLSFGFLAVPRLRHFAIVPFIAIYFTCYVNLTLTGSLPSPILKQYLPFSNQTSLQAFTDGENHAVIVQVNSLINQKNKSYFTAKLIAIDTNHLNYSPLIEMRWFKPNFIVQEGQIHRFIVRIKPVFGYANPSGFDRQKWRYSQHIAYQASIKEHVEIISDVISLRARFYRNITSLTETLQNKGIILALSFADKTLIDFDKKELIQKLAISHLFAISGLHIGLLFSLIFFIANVLIRRLLPNQLLGWSTWRLVNLLALVGAFFYAYLAGFSLPTQRAFLMLLFGVLVLSMKRKCGLVDLLSLTLLVILLWDPLAILSVSLWMSFIAVAIILLVMWRFPGIRLRSDNETGASRFVAIKGYIKFLIVIQLSLTLLMLPMQLMTFSAFNWLSPLINFVAVPLFSLLIIPLILMGCLLSILSNTLSLFFLTVADHLISLFFELFSTSSQFYTHFSALSVQNTILIISVILVLLLVYFQAKYKWNNFIFVVVFIIVLGTSLWQKNNQSKETWFVEVFDIGQGLAVLVRTHDKVLLYDSGPRYPSGYTTASTVILPYLQSLGIHYLDYFVISHSDIDHAGGVNVIVNNFAVKQFLLGEPLTDNKLEHMNMKLCIAGNEWLLGDLRIDVLSPFLLTNNDNNNSCVIRISDGNHSVLLTGDIEKKQESILIEKKEEYLSSNILLAPHHGSKHSSSEAFIAKVKPQWVVFSAGFLNRWKFPADEVKVRYTNQSVKMVNTGLNGFIRFKIEKVYIQKQTYREDLAPYWYHRLFSQQH
jgi:competence protein ComEC